MTINKHRYTAVLGVLILLSLTAQTCAAKSLSPQLTQPNSQAQNNRLPDDYHFVNDKQGWLLMSSRLFWTDTGGDQWKDITPAALDGWSIASAFFLDNSNGWTALLYPDSNGASHLGIAKTENGGSQWNFQPLILFNPADPAGIVDRIYLDFIDRNTGWMVVKRASSPTFSQATLFKTRDGGITWDKLAMPIGAPVYFINSTQGWTSGGVNGDGLFVTQDAGETWTALSLYSLKNDTERVVYRLPVFDSQGTGYLPVIVTASSGSILNVYQSGDTGRSWTLSSSSAIDLKNGSDITFSTPGDGRWVASSSSGQVIQGSSKGVERVAGASLLGTASGNKSALPGNQPALGISRLEMTSQSMGWATSQSGDCSSDPARPGSPKCTSSSNFLRSSDGGINWQPITLPSVATVHQGIAASQSPTASIQGFDTCVVPPVDQMATWIGHSPYSVLNLYIGGSWLGCKQAQMSLITNDYVGHLSQQGWRFIPTWVGLQAPCYCPSCSGKPQMSSDANTAYNQGVNEANAAIETAANLGLTNSSKASTIIYYDMEAFDYSNGSCQNAVKAFINGWTHQLHARLNKSGVYSTSCALSKSGINAIPNVPDDIWPAYWLIPFQYRSDASVYGIYCLSDQLWSNHQRFHQYSGEHNETWGGVTITALDNNVVDGDVAMWSNNGTDCPKTGGVIVYWDPNYNCVNSFGDTGYRMRSNVGVLNLNDGWINDKISSIKTIGCYFVILYSDINKSGYSVTINFDVPNLAALGNYPGTTIPVLGTVSSIEIIFNTTCVQKYFPIIGNNG